MVDSSGLEFFYVGTPRKQDAGIMFIGHRVTWNMIIPPNAERYRVVGMCVAECTQKVSAWKLIFIVCRKSILYLLFLLFAVYSRNWDSCICQ